MYFTTCSIRKIDTKLITKDIKVLREYISDIFSDKIYSYNFSAGIYMLL